MQRQSAFGDFCHVLSVYFAAVGGGRRGEHARTSEASTPSKEPVLIRAARGREPTKSTGCSCAFFFVWPVPFFFRVCVGKMNCPRMAGRGLDLREVIVLRRNAAHVQAFRLFLLVASLEYATVGTSCDA